MKITQSRFKIAGNPDHKMDLRTQISLEMKHQIQEFQRDLGVFQFPKKFGNVEPKKQMKKEEKN